MPNVGLRNAPPANAQRQKFSTMFSASGQQILLGAANQSQTIIDANANNQSLLYTCPIRCREVLTKQGLSRLLKARTYSRDEILEFAMQLNLQPVHSLDRNSVSFIHLNAEQQKTFDLVKQSKNARQEKQAQFLNLQQARLRVDYPHDEIVAYHNMHIVYSKHELNFTAREKEFKAAPDKRLTRNAQKYFQFTYDEDMQLIDFIAEKAHIEIQETPFTNKLNNRNKPV
jgi:hypothetical protein